MARRRYLPREVTTRGLRRALRASARTEDHLASGWCIQEGLCYTATIVIKRYLPPAAAGGPSYYCVTVSPPWNAAPVVSSGYLQDLETAASWATAVCLSLHKARRSPAKEQEGADGKDHP